MRERFPAALAALLLLPLAAVGANVAVPAGARQIDGGGLAGYVLVRIAR